MFGFDIVAGHLGFVGFNCRVIAPDHTVDISRTSVLLSSSKSARIGISYCPAQRNVILTLNTPSAMAGLKAQLAPQLRL
jgi:hypothetical protein